MNPIDSSVGPSLQCEGFLYVHREVSTTFIPSVKNDTPLPYPISVWVSFTVSVTSPQQGNSESPEFATLTVCGYHGDTDTDSESFARQYPW